MNSVTRFLYTKRIFINFTSFVVFLILFYSKFKLSDSLSIYTLSKHRLNNESLSAVLIRCPHPSASSNYTCHDKLMIRMLASMKKAKENIRYLLIDEVYDPRKEGVLTVLSPYLIEVRNSDPFVMYKMSFEKITMINDCNIDSVYNQAKAMGKQKHSTVGNDIGKRKTQTDFNVGPYSTEWQNSDNLNFNSPLSNNKNVPTKEIGSLDDSQPMVDEKQHHENEYVNEHIENVQNKIAKKRNGALREHDAYAQNENSHLNTVSKEKRYEDSNNDGNCDCTNCMSGDFSLNCECCMPPFIKAAKQKRLKNNTTKILKYPKFTRHSFLTHKWPSEIFSKYDTNEWPTVFDDQFLIKTRLPKSIVNENNNNRDEMFTTNRLSASLNENLDYVDDVGGIIGGGGGGIGLGAVDDDDEDEEDDDNDGYVGGDGETDGGGNDSNNDRVPQNRENQIKSFPENLKKTRRHSNGNVHNLYNEATVFEISEARDESGFKENGSTRDGGFEERPTITSQTIQTENVFQNKRSAHPSTDADAMNKQHPRIQSYSVYNLSEPTKYITTEIRIFRKAAKSWWKVGPTLRNSHDVFDQKNRLYAFHMKMMNKSGDNNEKLGFCKLILENGALSKDKLNQNPKLRNNMCCIENDQTNQNPVWTRELNTARTLNNVKRCRNADHICMNAEPNNIPAYTIFIELPFRRNALVNENRNSVQITRIVADGTIKGIIFVDVQLLSTGYISHEFTITIGKCPITYGSNVHTKNIILAHRAAEFNFSFPLKAQDENFENTCEVEIQDDLNRTVAKRAVKMIFGNRCFCIWNCRCTCIPYFAPTDRHTMCKIMSKKDYLNAGFSDKNDERRKVFNWMALIFIVFVMLLILLFFGLLKAIIGLGVQKVGQWKFDYISTRRSFDDSSKCRRFSMNLVFFLILPCITLCKCFISKNDKNGKNGDAAFMTKIVQTRMDTSDDDDDENGEYDEYDDMEFGNLQCESSCQSRFKKHSKHSSDPYSSPSERVFDSYNDEEEERDTNFVISALHESRESLRLLDGHFSESSENYRNDPEFTEAAEYVKKLLEAKVVYRILREPTGFSDVPDNQNFSIRGYFVPSVGTGYQFISTYPLRQYWKIDAENKTLLPIMPPKVLVSNDFTRNYNDKKDVFNAKDLILVPTVDAPCISVGVQDQSLYRNEIESMRGNDVESMRKMDIVSVRESDSQFPRDNEIKSLRDTDTENQSTRENEAESRRDSLFLRGDELHPLHVSQSQSLPESVNRSSLQQFGHSLQSFLNKNDRKGRKPSLKKE